MYNTYRKIKNNITFSINKGLTLIELMVVVSIFLIITTVVIFNYGAFNSSVSLQNLTDDIALSIRKAQGFAIGARGIGEDFKNSYGMHFSINPASNNLDSSIRSFLMFSVPISLDPLLKKYTVGTGSCGDGSGDNKCIEFFNIMTADYIKDIKVFKNSGDESIGPNAYVDIVFTRPDPRAYLCYRSSLNSDCESASRVEITISNGDTDPIKEKVKIISVQNTGQISIYNQI